MTPSPAPAGDVEPPAWADARLVASLLAIDPAGLGGVALRGGPGPAVDAWLSLIKAALAPDAPVRRAPLHIEDGRLLGGLDLAASLSAGRPVAQRGLLAECDGGLVILAMAERIETGSAARIAAVLDQGEVVLERDGLAGRIPARIGIVALDEGQDPDERPPAALMERLAFHIDLSGVRAAACSSDTDAIASARGRLAAVASPSEAILEALCATALAMGLDSARAPLLAIRAARAHAALQGRDHIETEDAAVAARLVLAPRALMAPADGAEEATQDESPEPPPEPPLEPETSPDSPEEREDQGEPPPESEAPADSELVLAAIQAALPKDLLERLALNAPGRPRAARVRGQGAKTKTARRGRPAGSRSGALRSGDRLNLVETLRAATPWQKLRGSAAAEGQRVQVRKEDFRIRRFIQRAETTTIIVVDASGSAAFQRLAEAKGAVELLLAKAYVSRTRVALVAFRGEAAETLLPPTRSLTRAKRQLAGLPGGGGTPLAAGIDLALRMALVERAADRTPLLVFLTDGRANIGLTGQPGRAAAEADALAAAARVRTAGLSAAYIDTASRPQPGGDRFARAMGAVYAPLPYLDAERVFEVVDGLRGGARNAA